MTERIIKTNDTEANHVLYQHQRFIIRSSKEKYRVNEVFHFLLYRNKRPVDNIVGKDAYLITLVMDDKLLPLEKGYQLIAFREL